MRTTQIPISLITGHGDIPMTVRAMKAGAIEFLTKPCRDEDLLTAIEQAIHRGRQMEQLKMLGVTRMQLSTRLKRFDLRG